MRDQPKPCDAYLGQLKIAGLTQVAGALRSSNRRAGITRLFRLSAL